ncbi:MAG: 1-acyl-sn-glycerol-3-phosphate acyltransferase [Bacteroidetes bacterium]|nr:1-acyl-sn-glycerol-3-phosphate acyltransferase [Bacteroidota bacterium]
MIYYLTILFFRIYFFFFLDKTVKGTENIPTEGAALLVSNHISLLDGPLLAVTNKRKLSAFAKKSVFGSKVKLWYLKAIGGIPVQSKSINRELLTKTMQLFNKGGILMIFPEGKINSSGELGEFKDGFIKIAAQFHVPIIPVTIKGTEKSLNKNQKFPKPAKVEVIYNKPIKLNAVKNQLTKEEIQIKVEKIKSIIQNNLLCKSE